MTYILANTGRSPVKWYSFNPGEMGVAIAYQLFDTLDLNTVPIFKTKTEAKNAALRLGLQTWRYVRF